MENPRDQRILFELLKRTKFFSEAHIRERLRAAHAIIRPILPEFVIRKRGARRTDVLVTYVDGEAKSGASYASVYAEENGIAGECVIGFSDFSRRVEQHLEKNGPAAALIVIDDLAATGSSIAENVRKFIEYNSTVLDGIKIRVVTLVATIVAQSYINSKFSEFDLDVEFRACDVLGPEAFAFSEERIGWSSEEQYQRARALCVNLGSHIYKANPLGFGNLGLLVVFPTTVPNNTLPILHSHPRMGSGQKWTPLFQRVFH